MWYWQHANIQNWVDFFLEMLSRCCTVLFTHLFMTAAWIIITILSRPAICISSQLPLCYGR